MFARMRWACLSWAVARWRLPTNSRHELARRGRNRSTIIGHRSSLRETQTTPRPLARTFALPIGTPPSAMVFASGYVRIGSMIKGGAILALLGIPLVALLGFYLGSWVLR